MQGKVAGPKGAAEKLRIPRSTLDSKIKPLKIKKHKFISEYPIFNSSISDNAALAGISSSDSCL
jgi:hypothetical protein